MRPTRRSRWLISLWLTGAGLLAASAAPASGAAGLTVGSNVDVSVRVGNEAETAIAIDPRDPRNVVIVSNIQFGNGLFKAVSADGGVTWDREIIGDGDGLGSACCDPSLAFDGFGNLFLIFLDSTAKRVQAALSVDGGHTFRFLATVEQVDNGVVKDPPTKSAGGGAGVDQPTVATGPGSVWVTWKQFSQHQLVRVRGASVLGLGRIGAWGPSVGVPGSRDGTFGDIVVGPRGQVLVTYQDNIASEGPSDIWVNLDPDGLGPAPMGPAIRVTATNVGGFDYIPPQARRSVDAEAGLAWDRSAGSHAGRVYLVYTDESPDESGDTDVFVRRSDDEGASWSAPVRVNDDRTRSAQFNPQVEVDQTTGIVGVGFHDARGDAGTGGIGDTNGVPNDDAMYYAAVSRDGGATFGANVRVSAGASNAAASNNGVQYGDYTGMAFHAGVLRPAWADNSNSTGANPDGTLGRFDLYSAAVTVH